MVLLLFLIILYTFIIIIVVVSSYSSSSSGGGGCDGCIVITLFIYGYSCSATQLLNNTETYKIMTVINIPSWTLFEKYLFLLLVALHQIK